MSFIKKISQKPNILALIISSTLLATPTVFAANDAGSSVEETSNKNFRSRAFTKVEEPPYSQDDIETEIIFGRELSSKILGKYPPLKNDKINAYVNKVGKLLATSSERSEINYRFIVLKSNMINAFAAPGGYIFITKGALDQVRDESELAGILAHEIGHIELRHYVKKMGLRSDKASSEDGFNAIMSGGGASATQALNQAIDETIDILFNKGLQSKTDEFEADQTSMYLLANTGYDTLALQRYFARIQKIKAKQTEQLAETHPPLSERITQMASLGLQDLNQAKLQERFNANY